LLTLGALIGGYAGLQALPTLLPERLDFAPLANAPGLRAYRAGPVSGTADPFVGIGTFETEEQAAHKAKIQAEVAQNLCHAVFGTSEFLSGQVPIASFSDYNCPFCRTQTQDLALFEAEDPGITLTWHELPLLGETSRQAAHAALAAKRQGAYVAFHKRLMRTRFVAAPEYLTVVAEDLGIDANQLLADIDGPEVRAALERSAALAQIFGLIGTPALVIGRVVVVGEVRLDTIKQIVDIERNDGWQQACA